MPSNVKANLLHDGIVDTLVSYQSARPGLPGVIVAAAATIGNVPRMVRHDIRGLLSKPSPSRQTDTKV
jgi:hypothetical protein